MVGENFRDLVEQWMARVPEGRVVTYGDIASFLGHPNASRTVGGIAHFGNPTLPWHRLVNRFGGLAAGFHGGRSEQARHLATEGVECKGDVVINFEEIRWRPTNR